MSTPQLVKVDESHLLVLWEEYNSTTGKYVTKMTGIDSDGNRATDIINTNLSLSDCQPIVNSDGLVTWYVSDGNAIKLYTVNIYNLNESCVLDTPSIKVNTTSTGVKISWGKNAKATGYYIYRSTDGKTYKKIKTITKNTTLRYTDTTAKKKGKKYYYKVISYKKVSKVTYKGAASKVKTLVKK